MAAASLAILLFVVLSISLSVFMFFRCNEVVQPGSLGNHLEGACAPFQGESMAERTGDAKANAEALGVATQFMLAHDVGDTDSMIEASKKYVYCEEGPGEKGEYRCENTPQKSDIEDAADSYMPYGQEFEDFVSAELPFLNGFSHSFTLDYDGGSVEGGSSGGAGLNSRVVFAVPIAGGENAELILEMSKGGVAVGVVEQ